MAVYRRTQEFLGAPLSNMMRMKGRGASLIAAEEIAKLLGGVVSTRPKSHLLELLRGCRRTSKCVRIAECMALRPHMSHLMPYGLVGR